MGIKQLFQADYDNVEIGSYGSHEQGPSVFRRLRRGAKAVLPPAFFLLLTWYFGWNALNGDHGLRAISQRDKDLALAKTDLDQAEQQRADWQKRVAGLQASHLDPDTLDERARAMLNMAEPNDIVIPYAKDKRLF